MIAYHGMTSMDAAKSKFQTDARSPGIWLSSSWDAAWWYQQSPSGGLIHTVSIPDHIVIANLTKPECLKAIFHNPLERHTIKQCLERRTLYLFNALETKVINDCWSAGYEAVLIPDKTNAQEHDSIVLKDEKQIHIIATQNLPAGNFRVAPYQP
jgi:hypothetical protein